VEGDGAVVHWGTPVSRWVLAATVVGSGMAFLDSTVVNVALPAIARNFGAQVAGIQWVLSGYLITLSAFVLLGGVLGDRYGRRRVFVVGAVWFALASLLCALAPTIATLIVARAVQGMGAALLVPGSLAILEASFVPDDRGRAIGAWTGLSGVASAFGPVVGGWLVTAVSWRLIFVLNLPLAVVVVIASRHLGESSDPGAARRLDWLGGALLVLGMGALSSALIEQVPPLAALAGVVLVAFVVVEWRTREPMLPLGVFRSRTFTAANLVTLAVYAALSGVLFLLVVDLQVVVGFSALAAGASLLPVTVMMLVLSPFAGHLARLIGPRLPMTVGPIVMAAGLLLMLRIGPNTSYAADVLPGVGVFALGLSLTVAPLTTAVLGALADHLSGVASGVNNAVARVAGLLAVVVLPVAAGLTGRALSHPARYSSGFHTATEIAAALCVVGAVLSAIGVPGRSKTGSEVPGP
jgi:EmrB/QacA subfamily drug resistance transporter